MSEGGCDQALPHYCVHCGRLQYGHDAFPFTNWLYSTAVLCEVSAHLNTLPAGSFPQPGRLVTTASEDAGTLGVKGHLGGRKNGARVLLRMQR